MGFTSKVKSTNTLSQLLTKLEGLDGKEATAGYDDTRHPAANMSYAELANIHEFGGKHIPARDFMTQAFHNSIADRKIYESIAENIIYGKGVLVQKELKKLADDLAKMISESILNGDFVELSPITIRIKGDSIPLRESDRLMNRVKSKVEKIDRGS